MHYERTPCFTRLKPRMALAAHQDQNVKVGYERLSVCPERWHFYLGGK
jgi:hypothetical protein